MEFLRIRLSHVRNEKGYLRDTWTRDFTQVQAIVRWNPTSCMSDLELYHRWVCTKESAQISPGGRCELKVSLLFLFSFFPSLTLLLFLSFFSFYLLRLEQESVAWVTLGRECNTCPGEVARRVALVATAGPQSLRVSDGSWRGRQVAILCPAVGG